MKKSNVLVHMTEESDLELVSAKPRVTSQMTKWPPLSLSIRWTGGKIGLKQSQLQTP